MRAHDVPDTEVLVVGGGPVGLAAAIEARLAGRDVVVVEQRPGTVDKACGEGLMPGALGVLRRWDVDPPGQVLAGIDYRGAGVEARPAVHRFRHRVGRGVRRTTLHAALLARATDLGIPTVTARVTDLTQDASSVTAAGIRSRWLLACDGLHSTVARRLGLEVPTARAGRRYGVRTHYRIPPWTDLVEVHWSDHAEAYVTPVTPGLVGVALLGPRGRLGDLTGFPALRERLADAVADGPARGAGPLRRRTVRRAVGRVRLVGDASGYVDALTGEGLRVGFAQAVAAVATLDDTTAYERAWRGATRDYRLLTAALVTTATGPLRSGIVPLARNVPALYGAVVERLAR